MDFYLMLVLVLTSNSAVSSVTVEGEITDDRSFYYRKLPAPPSKSARIEYTIMFPGDYVDLHIHTTEDHINIDKQCSFLPYGQFFNFRMHQELKQGQCNKGNIETTCTGSDKFQDYIPRNFGFSFGFKCDDASRKSLRGLSYSVTIKDQSNNTKCTPMTDIPVNCTQYYTLATFPNLIEHEDISDIPIELKIYLDTYNSYINTLNYQHFIEAGCYLFFPKCDPVNNIMIPPCKESVKDFREASPEFIHVMAISKQIQVSNTLLPDYLPSKNGSIPCFYKPATCPGPPNVTNAEIVSGINHNGTYYGLSEIEYECIDSWKEIHGNSKITCLYSRKWSHQPVCKINLLKILIPVLCTTVIILSGVGIGIIIRGKWKRKKLEASLTRIRSADAYVCYNFDTDDKYVIGTILAELEENQDPPLKLLVHIRDFQPGLQIIDNIENAIQNSNSAIIVMSQGFVNSAWCKEEFTHCYIENMNDPAFKLFVIMMQPREELENLSEYMKSFLAQQTYLERYDPNLFKKIGDYLKWVKEPKDSGGDAQDDDGGTQNGGYREVEDEV